MKKSASLLRQNLLILLIIFGSIGIVSAQDTPKKTSLTGFRRLQLGVNFSPDYCYRTLVGGIQTDLGIFLVNNRNKYEEPKIGYTVGLNVCYQFTKCISLESGIQYSNKGYRTVQQGSEITFGDAIDARHGFIFDSNASPIKRLKFIDNYNYLDIPLKVNFCFGKKRVRFITSVGFVSSFYINKSITTVIVSEDGKRNRDTDVTTYYTFNKFNLSPMLSVGIDLKINNRNSLRIEPTFKYGVLKIINTPLTAYLWNAGLNISYFFGVTKNL